MNVEALAKKIFDYPTPKSTSHALQLLNERAAPAEELALAAFRDHDKAAWYAIQRGVFGLPIFKVTSGRQADRNRPFIRGDLVAAGLRDLIWEIDEQHIEKLTPPKAMQGEEAAIFIEQEF